MRPSRVRLVIATLLVVSASLFVFFGHGLLRSPQRMLEETKQKARDEALNVTRDIAGKFEALQAEGVRLVEELNAERRSEPWLKDRLHGILDSGELGEAGVEVSQAGVAFAPYRFDASRRLVSVYVDQSRTGSSELCYDYSLPGPQKGRCCDSCPTDWYHVPMKKGSLWGDPYEGSLDRRPLAEFQAPFDMPDTNAPADGAASAGSHTGVAWVSFELDSVRQMVTEAAHEMLGWGVIFTDVDPDTGTIVSHPDRRLGLAHIRDLRRETHRHPGVEAASADSASTGFTGPDCLKDSDGLRHVDQILLAFAEQCPEGEAFRVVDRQTGRVHWLIHHVIKGPGWHLVVGFVEGDILEKIAVESQKIQTMLAGLATLLFLALLALGVERGEPWRLWSAAILFAVLCDAAIGWIWFVSYTGRHVPEHQDAVILEPISVEASLPRLWLEAGAPAGEKAIHRPRTRVPTGVFVKSVKFTGPYEVSVGGFIWQRRPEGKADDFKLGVVLPEGEEVSFGEAFELPRRLASEHGSRWSVPSNGAATETTTDPPGHRTSRSAADMAPGQGWSFRAILRQPFSYARYPFDREYVWIRMRYAGLFDDAILVPDLAAYADLRPESKPGLETEIVTEGWQVESAFFGYKANTYTTLLGAGEGLAGGKRPELYYNVALRRDFLASFISDMIPLNVISLLLFAVLMISTRKKQQSDSFGFNSAAVLAYCASLFFVLIVSHVHLRSTLAAQGVIYLEYFYFVLYFVILFVSVNSILLASGTRARLVEYEDGLIPKLLYWPVLSGLMLAVTIWEF